MKQIETTITLPVDSIKNILNIDYFFLTQCIDDIFESEDDDCAINTMNAYLKNNELVSSKYGECTLSDFKKFKMKSYDNVSFFNITVEFANGNEMTFVCPSYVSFYVNAKKQFISIFGIHKSDTFQDYAGRMVKIKKIELIEGIDEIEKSYYSIRCTYEIDESDINNEDVMNFYLNGILVNSPWHNFYNKQ